MRRAFILTFLTVAVIAASAALLALPALADDSAVQVTLPGTNTPRPMTFPTNTPAAPVAQSSPLPTVTPAPTLTPSLTLTPTLTDTLTLTSTFTPTYTPTPTFTPTPTLTPTKTYTPTPTFTPTPTNTFTPTPTPTNTFTPSPTPTTIGPVAYPENYNSLTGLPYPSDAAAARRNLVVKVSNYPPIVRPQSGLNAADVVFEYEVEGGVTRFAAIFRSNAPTHVGPVRSGRLVDLQIVPMFNALFAYSGSSDPIKNMILEVPWGLQVLSPQFGDNCVESGFCRFPKDGLAFEHTLYLDTNVAWDRATRRGVNMGTKARGFAFNETPDQGGLPASDLFIDWYGKVDVRWQYDAATGRYLRYTDGVPHFDAADGQQLWADNIVILEAQHIERPDLFEPESRAASQEIDLQSGGRAYLFRDGVYYQGLWRRKDDKDGSAIEIVYQEGNFIPIMLKPGRTYVEVVRWLGDAVMSTEQADMVGTATQIALSATPTPSFVPTSETTAEATIGPTATPSTRMPAESALAPVTATATPVPVSPTATAQSVG